MHIENSARLSYQMIDSDNSEDRELLLRMEQDPEVMRYINGGKPVSREAFIRDAIPRLNAYRNIAKGWGLWKVRIAETGAAIGFILVRPMDFFSDAPKSDDLEFGWRFLRSSWGKGYATEAAVHTAKVFSQMPEYQYLSAVANPNNKASIGVMKKMGMQYVKTCTLCDSQLGEFHVVLYQLEI